MKNKRFVLKMLFTAIILFLIFGINLEVDATDHIFQTADNFLEKDKGSILNMDSIKMTSDTLFDIFSAVGVAIVLIVGAVLGIQFMTGSIEEKAKIKEAMIPYVAGASIIFGAVIIWQLVANVLEGIFK